nr:alpha,alpha-trehalose-phosphate synthase [UDP-forming] 6-like [Tanacetum cinerariifolium]
MLNTLCRDKNNMVFIVCSRTRSTLREWFASCEKVRLTAEHGCFLRLKRDEQWDACTLRPEDEGAYPMNPPLFTVGGGERVGEIPYVGSAT